MTSIRVIGLGAMGAAHAARIAKRAPDVDLGVVASGERADRIRRRPLLVNDEPFSFTVIDPREAAVADLVIVTVKYHQLSEAIEQIRSLVGPHTVILSLLNGISSESDLAAAFPGAVVPLAVSVGIDAVRDDRGVHYSSLGRVEFGDAGGPSEPSAGVRRLAELLEVSGLPHLYQQDMEHVLWWKFLVNVGVNQVSALLEAPYRLFQQDGPARDLMISAQQEVVAVASASGIGLTDDDITSWLGVLDQLGPDNYTSMAQDALAHRRTEVDMLAGTVVARGRATGVATPVNEVLLRALHARHIQWGVDES